MWHRKLESKLTPGLSLFPRSHQVVLRTPRLDISRIRSGLQDALPRANFGISIHFTCVNAKPNVPLPSVANVTRPAVAGIEKKMTTTPGELLRLFVAIVIPTFQVTTAPPIIIGTSLNKAVDHLETPLTLTSRTFLSNRCDSAS